MSTTSLLNEPEKPLGNNLLLFKYTSFPKEGQLFNAGGNASVDVQLSGECMNSEIDSVIIRIYHKASLYAEHIQKMNFSGGKAPFSFTPELEGSNEKYKFKVYFIRKIIEEVDTIVKDVGVTNSTDIKNSGKDNHIFNVRTLPCPDGKRIVIDINNENRGDISIKLLNIKGRLIFSKPVTNVSVLRESIDVSNKSQGVYLLVVKTGGLMETRKIIMTKDVVVNRR